MKHDLRFRRTGKFRPRLLRDTPLLDAMFTGKSEPHVRGNRTRAERQRAMVLDGMEQLRMEVAMRLGWLA